MIENFMWMPYPCVRYAFCLAFGIVVSFHRGTLSVFTTLFIVSTAAFTIMFFFRSRLKQSFSQLFLGSLGLIMIFNLGAIRFQQNNQRNLPTHLIQLKDPVYYYTATVIDDVVALKNYSKLPIFITAVKTQKSWKKTEAKALLYVRHDTSQVTIGYGDKLLVKGKANIIEGASNPKAFDYQKYMALQNVFHQHFIKSHEVIKFQTSERSFVPHKVYQLKKRAREIISTAILHQREKSIVMSLLIGERTALGSEVKKIYSEVGAMHVLAVSGLHVGIVYLLISGVLGFLKKYKKLKWIFMTISMTTLWFYAMLTGFSTSVLRSVVMFTLILVSDFLHRKSSIYNNIALAAFLLLMFNPNFLFQVGFQLSFAAVVGIVYLQPKIAGWCCFKNIFFDKVWKLTAVSIAAQIGTFPISVFYFHQFPTYFWVANLIVIPAATVILVLGIVVLTLGSLGNTSSLFSALLEKVVFFTNEGLSLIHAFPVSSIGNLHFTVLETLFIYASMITMIRFLITFKIRHLTLSLFFVFAYSSGVVLQYFRTSKLFQIVFYDVKKTCAIDLIDGHKQNLLLIANHKISITDLQAAAVNYRLTQGLDTKDLTNPSVNYCDFNKPLRKGYEFYSHRDVVILLLNKTVSFDLTSETIISIDYLVVNNQAIRDFNQIKSNFRFKRLIISNLNSFGYASALYDYCIKNEINVYSVIRDGALVENISRKKNFDESF